MLCNMYKIYFVFFSEISIDRSTNRDSSRLLVISLLPLRLIFDQT